MDDVVKLQCRLALEAIEELHREKKIDDAIYYKGVVALSYEYALGEELDLAVGLLLRVPISYYQEHQLDQMHEDPTYCEIVIELARALVLAGYLDSNFVPPGAARA